MIVSVHIPKTAGTSLLQHWVNIFGAENVAVDYMGVPIRYSDAVLPISDGLKTRIKGGMLKYKPTRLLLDLIQQQRAKYLGLNILDYPTIKVVHGHFPAEKYTRMPQTEFVTVLREPWSRVISHFMYNHEQYSQIRHRLPNWFYPGMPISEFLLNEDMINLQTKFLKGLDLNRITLLGTTENYDLFCSELYKRYAPGVNYTPVQNNKGRKAIILPEDELESAKQLFLERNQLDLELYHNNTRIDFEFEK